MPAVLQAGRRLRSAARWPGRTRLTRAPLVLDSVVAARELPYRLRRGGRRRAGPAALLLLPRVSAAQEPGAWPPLPSSCAAGTPACPASNTLLVWRKLIWGIWAWGSSVRVPHRRCLAPRRAGRWAGGLTMLTLFTLSSIYTSYLLAALHEHEGRRLNTYRELGEAILGGQGVGGWVGWAGLGWAGLQG